MRPPKQGLLLYAHHIFVRNGMFYYRADIPSDLLHFFHTTEIKHSLKTKDSKIAKELAVGMEYRLQRVYAMIRTGMLPDDVIQGMVDELYPRRKAVKRVGRLLSSLADDYVKANEEKWTHKTRLDVNRL